MDGSDEFQMSFQPPIWMNFQVPKGTPRKDEQLEPENDGGGVQMMFRKFPRVEFLRFQPLIFRGYMRSGSGILGDLLTDECPFFVGQYGFQSWKKLNHHQGNRIRIRTSISQSAEIHRIER